MPLGELLGGVWYEGILNGFLGLWFLNCLDPLDCYVLVQKFTEKGDGQGNLHYQLIGNVLSHKRVSK